MQIISTNNSSSIQQAINTLKSGGIIIFPTETCYGIGIDATNADAVTKLLNYKGDRYRQVSIAVSNQNMAQHYVQLNSMALNLYQQFLPGPITVISQSLHQTDLRLESSEGTLGIRYPKHSFTLKLIQQFGKPITATSANTSGKKEPYSLQDWQKYTSKTKQNYINLFLDAGQLLNRPTSTVVDTTLNDPQILRQGTLQLPDLSPTFISHSTQETINFAKQLLTTHLNLTRQHSLIIALSGELGAGKTQLAKGFTQALNINSPLTSPTYTLMKEYPYTTSKYSGTFYHLDTWRLKNIQELDTTLHLSSLLQPNNIICLEWANKANNWLNQHQLNYPTLLINLKVLDQFTRQFTYSLSTPEWS